MSDHGTYETVDGRPALTFERAYPHPVERVWRAVTEPGELAHWFPAAVELEELRPGAPIAYTFPGEVPGLTEDDLRGEVLEVDEPHRFAFTWGGEELRIELREADGGTRLLFTHLLAREEHAARTAAGWHVCLRHLGERLDGAAPGMPGTEPTDEHHRLRGEYERQLAT